MSADWLPEIVDKPIMTKGDKYVPTLRMLYVYNVDEAYAEAYIDSVQASSPELQRQGDKKICMDYGAYYYEYELQGGNKSLIISYYPDCQAMEVIAS